MFISQKKHEIVQFFPYISSKNTVLKSFFPQMKFKSNLELVYMIFYGKRNYNFYYLLFIEILSLNKLLFF